MDRRKLGSGGLPGGSAPFLGRCVGRPIRVGAVPGSSDVRLRSIRSHDDGLRRHASGAHGAAYGGRREVVRFELITGSW